MDQDAPCLRDSQVFLYVVDGDWEADGENLVENVGSPRILDLPGKEFDKMMGCLPGRRTLWAGLAAVVLAGAGGCVEDESLFLLHPEGPPEVVAVFVNVDQQPDYEVSSVYAELLEGAGLTYGAHPDVNGGAPVDGPVQFASLQTDVRVVVDELLRGRTAEQFKCACWDPNAASTQLAVVNNCPTAAGTQLYSDSPDVAACTGCPDSTATDTDETGRCEDANLDGVPDDSVLKPGLFSLTCDDPGFTAVTSGVNNGIYTPSGNLVLPALNLVNLNPIDGLGPAIRFHPLDFYPSDSLCTLRINANMTLTDKDDIALAPVDVTFHTAFTVAAPSIPDESEDVPGDDESGEFTFEFNGPIDVSDANLQRVTLVCTGGTGGGPAEVVLNSVEEPVDPQVLTIVAPDGFGFEQTCTVTVAAGFVDQWGNPIVVELSEGANPRTLTFTTAEE
jgi:hypothetical protein